MHVIQCIVGVLVGKSTELYCWRNQLNCNEELSLLEPAWRWTAHQLFEEFAFCKEICKFSLFGLGMALVMGAVRASCVLPWEMDTCHFHRAEVCRLMAWRDEIQHLKTCSLCLEHGCVINPWSNILPWCGRTQEDEKQPIHTRQKLWLQQLKSTSTLQSQEKRWASPGPGVCMSQFKCRWLIIHNIVFYHQEAISEALDSSRSSFPVIILWQGPESPFLLKNKQTNKQQNNPIRKHRIGWHQADSSFH